VHRDVNAHNILLKARSSSLEDKDDDSPADDVFTLIDFGLASDAKGWQNGDWKTENIGGDCRYWPVSCWKQFLFGFKYLLSDPVDVEEYVHNLDAHSLSLTCLQLLNEVTTGPRPPHAEALFSAFATYWKDAVTFHTELFAVFQGKGNWAALKKSFLQQQIVEVTRRNLDRLKHALDACAKGEDARTFNFLRCIRKMISGQHTDWGDLQKILQGLSPAPAQTEQAAPVSVVDRLSASVRTVEPAITHHTSSDGASASQAPAMRKFTHRRQSTADISLSRYVPEVGAAQVLRRNEGGHREIIHSASGSLIYDGGAPLRSRPSSSNNLAAMADAIPSPPRQFNHRRVRSSGFAGPSVGVARQDPLSIHDFPADQGMYFPADQDMLSGSVPHAHNRTMPGLRKITESIVE